MTFAELLESKYIEWQHAQGKRKTLEEFAIYVGVSRPLLNMWMNGNRKPGKESLRLLSMALGNEVYDVLGYARPNPLLQQLNARWERIPPEKQQQLLELSEQYEIKNTDEQQLQATSQRRKKTARK